MSFLFHSVVFELILGSFSIFPSYVLWILVLIASWCVGKSFESFGRTLFVVTSAFIIGGIASYFLMSYYIRETPSSLVQMITLKMISVSLLTLFTLSAVASFFGYMFRR